MGDFTLTTTTNGMVEKVDATHAKVKLMRTSNPSMAGITLYVKYTKGPETTETLSYSIVPDEINRLTTVTTDIYLVPKSSSGGLTQESSVMTGTNNWVIPIAMPASAKDWIYITVGYTGSTHDSTTTVLINAERDTVDGN
jgi:hypothetical protein